MPLFEIETDSHIIITWATDEQAARQVVAQAYPGDQVTAHDQASTRYMGHLQRRLA